MTKSTTTAIKGFDHNLACRDFQFEVGQTYTHGGHVEVCKSGFHAIPDDLHPLSVFQFYPPAKSRYCLVDISGKTDRESDKIAAEIVSVKREICLGTLIHLAVDFVTERAVPEGEIASGYQGAATASGDQGAASASGTRGAASASGFRGAASASGYQGAATASGDQGAASASGYQGAATASGYQGAATASGDQGAATASGTRGAASASGFRGAATASGAQGAASASGDQGVATASGDQGAATASHETAGAYITGYGGTVSGVAGAAIHADERADDGTILSVACGIVGRGGIEPGVKYRCVAGELIPA